MKTFLSATIGIATVVIGHALGFPEWADVMAGMIIGPTASGPVTTMVWDDSHKRKRLPK